MYIDRWLIDSLYESILKRDCTPRTISISKDGAVTGGHPDLVPLHWSYPDYISLQQHITNMSKKRGTNN